MTSKRKWLRVVLIVAVLLAATNIGISRALRTNAAREYLIARLAASFGRPVDVARFDFSLFDGARLEAHSITVAEDPHFGNEYFLRAETLTAGLRWPALFSGRFEFGSLSLMRPSLNLVRDAEGQWNIERWLPPTPSSAQLGAQPGDQSGSARPGFVGPLAAPRAFPAARLYRIDVDGGRINFKQRDDKSPFAFTDVSGRVGQDSAGRWQLDLEALPMRAGVELQDIGALRVRGTIAGTSARLQPAEITVSWRAASLADTLRLARQNDYGMRGALSVDLAARVAPPETGAHANAGGAQWSISAVARLTGIHGWRLPGHDTDPAANLSVDASWRLGESRAQIRNLLVEMPASHLQGNGDVDWGHGFHPQFHIESSTLGLADLLSWYRSLSPDVADDLRAEGSFGVDLTMAGWPLQLQQGAIASSGATLTATSLPAPLQMGPVNAGVSRGGLDFAATEVSFSPPPGENAAGPESRLSATNTVAIPNFFIVRGSISPETGGTLRWPPNWNLLIEGGTSRVQDWLAISQKLAAPLNAGWSASGGLAVKMRGSHRRESSAAAWIGTMDSRDLVVSPAYVNQPLGLPKAHLELNPAQQTITLSAAQAFGANWRGTIGRKLAAKQWTFDLTADRLDVTELDRWLGPRARPGFLERITGFGSDAAVAQQTDSPSDAQSVSPSDTVVGRIEARGRLRVDEIAMPPIRLEKFDGDAELSGRTIKLRKSHADFFGGQVSGTLDAALFADPTYEFQVRFDRVNLEQLAREVPYLNDRIAGTATASLSISTHGIGRENLVGSLGGNGTLSVRNVELRGFDLKVLFPDDGGDASSSLFSSLQGAYQIRGGGIDIPSLTLERSRGQVQADGRIEFSHVLNLHIRSSMSLAANSSSSTLSSALPPASPPSFFLSGTIEAPKLVNPSSAPKPAAKSGVRTR